MGETQIRLMLNRVSDDFLLKTHLLSGYATLDITADQRYYDFSDFTGVTNDDDVLEVYQVDYDNIPIDQFVGVVENSDADEG